MMKRTGCVNSIHSRSLTGRLIDRRRAWACMPPAAASSHSPAYVVAASPHRSMRAQTAGSAGSNGASLTNRCHALKCRGATTVRRDQGACYVCLPQEQQCPALRRRAFCEATIGGILTSHGGDVHRHRDAGRGGSGWLRLLDRAALLSRRWERITCTGTNPARSLHK